MVKVLNGTDEIKAGQLGPLHAGSILLAGIHSWKLGGIYQEDMNEVVWAATKAMCEK